MKKIFILISTLFFLTLFSSLVLAAFTVTISMSKSLTENEQTTVTVTVENTGTGTESNVIATLSSSPSWFNVVSDCTTISSITAGQSQTSTCIIRPTSTGSGLSLSVNAESSGGTTGSGTTSGITVASSSSSLTASVTGDSSVSKGATFYVGVTVTAPSSTDSANVVTTISESGQCTVDTSYQAKAQNIGNVTKGQSKSPTSWKLTSTNTDGTCTVSVSVTSDNTGTASPSKSITVGSGSGGGGSSGTSAAAGGGGGGATETKKVSVIPAGGNTTVKFLKADELKVQEIFIKVKTTVTSVSITVKESSKPTFSPQVIPSSNEIVFKYLEITTANLTNDDVDSAKIKFKVDKSWVDDNKVDLGSVNLYRYDGTAWEKLKTTFLSQDSASYNFEGETTKFSVFAIAAEKIPQPTTETTTTTTKTPQPPFTGISIFKGNNMIFLVVIAIWIILGAVIVQHYRKKIAK